MILTPEEIELIVEALDTRKGMLYGGPPEALQLVRDLETVKQKITQPLSLRGWDRESIRILARKWDIPRGRNTRDTLRNLANAGRICPHCLQTIPIKLK